MMIRHQLMTFDAPPTPSEAAAAALAAGGLDDDAHHFGINTIDRPAGLKPYVYFGTMASPPLASASLLAWVDLFAPALSYLHLYAVQATLCADVSGRPARLARAPRFGKAFLTALAALEGPVLQAARTDFASGLVAGKLNLMLVIQRHRPPECALVDHLSRTIRATPIEADLSRLSDAAIAWDPNLARLTFHGGVLLRSGHARAASARQACAPPRANIARAS